MIKTAIIGASGYIGSHLWAAYNKTFPGTLGTAFSSNNPALLPFDIRKPNIDELQLEEQGYQAAIIAAANPNVRACADHWDETHSVNVQGTLELIRQLGKTFLQTIFFSTDYVFEGSVGNYDDDAPIAPTTEYGRQKAMVEEAIPSLTDNFLILRLGKIYGIEKGDKTLIDEIANLLSRGETALCASDQFFSPMLIQDVVMAISHIQTEKCQGVLNICSTEICSRYEIASVLAEEMRADPGLVKKVGLHNIPSMVGRPLNTTMKSNSPVIQALQREFTPLIQSIKSIAGNYTQLKLGGA